MGNIYCEILGCIWNYWFICPSSINLDATVGDWSYCEYIWGGCGDSMALPPPAEVPFISISDVTGNHDDLYFYLGEYCSKCYQKAAALYREGTIQDDEKAWSCLGWIYEQGLGCKKNFKRIIF